MKELAFFFALGAAAQTYWWADLWISAKRHWGLALWSFDQQHGCRPENKARATAWLRQMRWITFATAVECWFVLCLVLHWGAS